MSGFATTRWTLVLRARDVDDARAALETLCRIYRAPVLGYVRRHSRDADAAEDLTQAFFADFLANAYHADANPQRGRFRTFLLTAVKRFLIDAHVASRRRKRGGEFQFEVLDGAGEHIAGDDTPEAAFERDWALAILDSALTRLRDEAKRADKLALFEHLREFLIERPDETDYSRVAAALNLRSNTIAVAVHRLRHRLRAVVREEIAGTADSDGDLDSELRDMRRALRSALKRATLESDSAPTASS
jgi:RNA polymerase sigma factor (sigma-70 family)